MGGGENDCLVVDYETTLEPETSCFGKTNSIKTFTTNLHEINYSKDVILGQLHITQLIESYEPHHAVGENLHFAYAKSKVQTQCLCFRYIDSTILLLPKSEMSSL